MQELSIFFIVFGPVFLAEIGDKSQLAVISLTATSDTPKLTVLGILSGLTIVSGISVILGGLIEQFIPLTCIQIIAGIFFIIIGILTFISTLHSPITKETSLKNGSPNQTIENNHSWRHPFYRSFALIVLMELGDKTQIILTLMSATFSNILVVFLGGIIALFAVNLIGITLGYQLGIRLPQRSMEKASAILFILLGVWIIIEPILGI